TAPGRKRRNGRATGYRQGWTYRSERVRSWLASLFVRQATTKAGRWSIHWFACLLPHAQAICLATAYRRLVGTGIAAVSEEAGGILSGDAVERGSKRLSKSLDGARSDPPQIGLHLSPARFDRAEVRAVAGQIAIGKA